MKDINLKEKPSLCDSEFLTDTLHGLSLSQKMLPSKYFYDEKGSQLFDQICELQEYYLTRTESKLLNDISKDLDELLSSESNLLEPGSGAGDKLKILLSSLSNLKKITLLDISQEMLVNSGKKLRSLYPQIEVNTIVGDFTEVSEYHEEIETLKGDKVIFFPGSTIGNFSPIEAGKLLSSFASVAGENGALLIGVDQIKDKTLIEEAYNDSKGITAEFNLNMLRRINRELNGTFNTEQFTHKAFYNAESSHIEMHLVSSCPQTASVNGTTFNFSEGETIHTENSYKYSPDGFRSIARTAGWHPIQHWEDPNKWFGLHFLKIDKMNINKIKVNKSP